MQYMQPRASSFLTQTTLTFELWSARFPSKSILHISSVLRMVASTDFSEKAALNNAPAFFFSASRKSLIGMISGNCFIFSLFACLSYPFYTTSQNSDMLIPYSCSWFLSKLSNAFEVLIRFAVLLSILAPTVNPFIFPPSFMGSRAS